jgi:predicted TIM-barrel fold metal-dependent hydrolase
VAALDPQTATSELLNDYARRGVCGARVNLYSTVSKSAEHHAVNALLEFWFSRVPRAGWHVEIIAPLAVLAHAAQAIARSPVPVVLDHYGLPGAVSPDSAEGSVLLELARLPHVWIKLSAPYRILADPLATVPPAAWLRALVAAAPDRCVWGSDWPHTPARDDQMAAGKPAAYRKFAYAALLGQFIDALSDAALAKQILADNPARLYGFPSGC